MNVSPLHEQLLSIVKKHLIIQTSLWSTEVGSLQKGSNDPPLLIFIPLYNTSAQVWAGQSNLLLTQKRAKGMWCPFWDSVRKTMTSILLSCSLSLSTSLALKKAWLPCCELPYWKVHVARSWQIQPARTWDLPTARSRILEMELPTAPADNLMATLQKILSQRHSAKLLLDSWPTQKLWDSKRLLF